MIAVGNVLSGDCTGHSGSLMGMQKYA